MTIQEHIEYWTDSADNDLKTADALFETGNYSWTLFISHLILEKALKAHYVKSNNNAIPPKIHNLSRLAELTDLMLDEETEEFHVKANKFNIEGRYPQYKNEFYKLYT